MIQWTDTTSSDRVMIRQRAEDYKHEHASHVHRLYKSARTAIAPSGSDLFKPELWKPIHWKWYLDTARTEAIW